MNNRRAKNRLIGRDKKSTIPLKENRKNGNKKTWIEKRIELNITFPLVLYT